MDPQTEHNPNRIPYRGFFGKPVGSMAWSLASNESIYSLHTGNVSLSREYGFVGLAAALKLDETQKSNELVNKITETNPVLSLSLSPVKESLNTVQSDYENDDENKGEDMIKPTNEEDEISDVSGEVENDVKEIKQEDSSELVYEITETNLTPPLPPVEKSENCKKPKSESDDNKDEEIIKFHSEEHEISGLTEKQEEREEVEDDDDLGKEIKPNESNEPVNQITETDLVPLKESRDTEKSDSESDDEDEMKEEVEDDLKEIIADDSSICCRSDTSNNSISSFSFPILHNEDGSVKTPCLKTSWNVFDKMLELSQGKTQTQTQMQPQFYFIPATHTLTHLPPQHNSSSNQASQMQSQKTFRNRWFSCFFCPFQHD